MNFLFYCIGKLCGMFEKVHSYYKNCSITKQLGGGKIIQYPYRIAGVENLKCEGPINIGKGSVLFCSRAPIVIKGHFVSGPNLTIITGDHMPLIGKFIDCVTDFDKDEIDTNHLYDKEVIIEDDVWCGANVTILKGVTLGRGCIIAAGAVVTKSIPPYAIAGGVPAKPIKFRWSVEQIMQHEQALYKENERFTKKQLDRLNLSD